MGALVEELGGEGAQDLVLPSPAPVQVRTCGDSASRSTETTRPLAPNPMTGADSLAAATSSRVLGSLKTASSGASLR